MQNTKIILPTADDIARVKGLGCLRDKRYPDRFNVRVVTKAGRLTAAQLRALADAAEQFGTGEVAMTSRLSVEVQSIPFAQLDAFFAYLAKYDLYAGGTGPKVRPVVSCKGTSCQYGLIDTFSLAEKIHEQFYVGMHDIKLPHKFKIAVGGCPNNCVKPDLNDIGIIGYRAPAIDPQKCRACNLCQVEKACPIHLPKVTGTCVHIEDTACNHCGRCIAACPFGALSEQVSGYRMYISGTWGKRVSRGKPLSFVFTSEEQVLCAIACAIDLFKENGIAGERFAATVQRLGFENVENTIRTAVFGV